MEKYIKIMEDNVMSMERINDEDMGMVVGGLFIWHMKNKTMTYTHQNGKTTVHQVIDMNQAWELSNELHGQLVPEDEILNQLISKGYIAG